MKDISAFANHPSDEDKYIIIGIKEKNGTASDFYSIDELVDQAKYQQLINNNIEPEIRFEYKQFDYKEHKLSYFRIFGNHDRPYLMKKEVRSSVDASKIEFREGEGFIRVGTSTRRLIRSDLDNIYGIKYKNVDRKSDLMIAHCFGTIDNDDFSGLYARYFDISIENGSNQSLNVEVEMKVFKGENVKLVSDYDLRLKLIKPQVSEYMMPEFYSPILPPFNTSIEDSPDSLIITRNGNPGINISQNSIEKYVFDKQLLILGKESASVRADVTIRSDDFTEGALFKSLEFIV